MQLIGRGNFPWGGVSYWLQADGINAEEREGSALDGGRGGHQREAVSLVESCGHPVQRAGGQITQQALEAVDRSALGGEFAGALAQRGRRRLGGGDDRSALTSGGHRVIIIKQDRFEALAHVPFDVAGEHAEKDMSAHPRGEPVVDRAQVQIDGLEAAKGTLDPSQALVGADHAIRRQGFGLKAGADDIKAVEPRLRGNAGLVAAKGEAVFGNGNVEVFGEPVAVFEAADGTGDLVLSLAAAAVGDLVGELAKRRLGGAQQVFALAGPFLGQ